MPITRFTRAAAALLALAGAAVPSFAQAPAQGTNEQADVVVYACVNKKGELLGAEVARSSGFPELDAAALKVARATKFAPATKDGKPKRKSCLHFKVKFVVKDGVPVPAGSVET